MNDILKNNNFSPVSKKSYGLLMKSPDGGVAIKYKDGNVEGFIKNTNLKLEEGMRHKLEMLALLSLGIMYFTTDVTIVDGDSMEPNYINHQIIIKTKACRDVNKMLINKNAVIKFKDPKGTTCIKRVKGIPGDTIEFDNFIIKINGKIIDKNNLNDIPTNTSLSMVNGKEIYTMKLKDNQYFVVGDNKPDSMDSREYGPINKSAILSVITK